MNGHLKDDISFAVSHEVSADIESTRRAMEIDGKMLLGCVFLYSFGLVFSFGVVFVLGSNPNT